MVIGNFYRAVPELYGLICTLFSEGIKYVGDCWEHFIKSRGEYIYLVLGIGEHASPVVVGNRGT